MKKLYRDNTISNGKKRVFFLFAIIVFSFSCASGPGPVSYEKGASVAVWDLDNMSPSSDPDPGLGELLSGKIIEAFQKRGDYMVVERQRLLLALEELHLGSSSLADETTRLKLGKIVGARTMVFGCYMIVGGQMRLDLRMVDVESGKVMKAVQKTSLSDDMAGWLDAATKAAEEF